MASMKRRNRLLYDAIIECMKSIKQAERLAAEMQEPEGGIEKLLQEQLHALNNAWQELRASIDMVKPFYGVDTPAKGNYSEVIIR